MIQFHNKLKTSPHYLNYHVNRHCNDLIDILLTIEHDLFHERMRKDVIMTSEEAIDKPDWQERHSHGERIPDLSVMVNVYVT